MPSPQRMPAKERMISRIASEDPRISIVGTVVDFKDSILVVDDGSGKMDISFEQPPEVKVGQLVRVYGRVIVLDEGFEMRGEICQDFSDANLELWRNVSDLWDKSLKQL